MERLPTGNDGDDEMKTTIDMAREAGFVLGEPWREALVKSFADLVRADEREACAKVCEELVPDMSRTANDASVWDVATFDCAIAIRNRGNI
jgi:hypothetical protein